ncbi:MAG: hypothetical protein HYY58_01975 [Candidatus Omnitrophica bacterium]|nr:hypothetical protein [Candidatus Omnitrophota bacterium]
MRRAIPWLIIVGWAGVAAGFLLRGRYPSAPAPVGVANAPSPQASPSPATTGRIAHTFADEASVQAFVALWQQRQGILVRLAMLEDYGKNEQLALQQLDSALRSQYALDPEGSYTIDTDQRAILKEGTSTVAEAVAAAPAGAKRGTAPKGKTKVTTAPSPTQQQKERVHTFADDAAMEEFMNLWRQRQGAAVRLDVLRAYWDSEKIRLDQLDKQLAADYQVDVTKPYTLDEQRRALIEHEPPPVPQLPPTPPAVSDSMQKDTGRSGAPSVTAQEPPVQPPDQPQDQ